MSILKFVAVGAMALLAANAAFAQPLPSGPVRVIYDTDMWDDIDDVLALAMLHTLRDRGEVNILAITSSTEDKWCAPFIDALDTYYGHANIPIGSVKKGVRGTDVRPSRGVNYTQYISELRKPNGAVAYPHALKDGFKAMEAVALLRKTLAAQPDGSVVMIQVGFSTNLANLLDSTSDAVSPLTGIQLVERKVRLLSMMAGDFREFDVQGEKVISDRPEFNVRLDIPSAQKVFDKWPTPIVASGFEIGVRMLFKGENIERDFSYARDHLVAATYRYSDPVYRSKNTPLHQLHDHGTMDLTSVLYAVRPDDGYFSLSPAGTITILPDGLSRFEAQVDGTRRYLVMNNEQRAKALEVMSLLVTQPPVSKRR